jgi:hypothetical protein
MAFLREHLLKLGLISEEDFHFFRIAHDVDDAVAEIQSFYRNYHSYRWVGARMVMRLYHKLTDDSVAALNEQFSDILDSSEIRQSEALPEERNEPDLAELSRLVLTPHRRNFGRFRKLIDAINAADRA